MTTLDLILTKYGILLDLKQVSDLLHRSPVAIRQSLGREQGIGSELRNSAIRRGRRLYFRASDLAAMLDRGQL